MHYWGDDWEYWDDLNRAIDEFAELSRKHPWPVRDIKEKYGTMRCYCSLGWDSLHTIIHPRRIFCRWPKWIWRLNLKLTSAYAVFPLGWLWRKTVLPYSFWLCKKRYRRAYKTVVNKYPHIAKELVCAVDYRELLEDLWKPQESE